MEKNQSKESSHSSFLLSIEKEKEIKKLKNLVINYLMDRYDLKSLLEVKNDLLEETLIRLIKEDNFSVISQVEESILLKEAGFFNVILQIEYEWETLNIALKTKIYDEKVMMILYEEDTLHLLYEKTKDNKILDFLISQDFNFSHFRNFKDLVSAGNRKLLLDKLMKLYDISEILAYYSYFDNTDLKYLCHITIPKLKTSDAYYFLTWSLCYEEDKKELLNKILLSNNAKYLYKVLIKDRIVLTKEEKENFEKALKDTHDFEYNFYYEFKNNENILVSIFGSYIALRAYLNNNEKKFIAKEVFGEIVVRVNKMALEEEKVIIESLDTCLFKGDENHENSCNRKRRPTSKTKK